MKRILFIGMLFIIMSQIAFAQTFSVQGVLRDPLGKTVDDGYYSVTFRLYEQSTGGTAVWSETQGSVQVLHGVFNVELGTVTSLSDTPFDTTYWLGISIEGGTELEPRFKLLKTPAAMSVLGTDNVFPSKGNIGAGTLNPTAGLHIVTQSANTDLLKIESAGGGFIKVTSDGKMGVNVSDPNNPLAISGNLRLRDGGAIVFDDGTQIASANFGGSATGVASPGNALITSDAEGIGTGEIQFFIDTDPKMVIDHDGNVGIGTTNPSYGKLHINYESDATQYEFYRHSIMMWGDDQAFYLGVDTDTRSGYLQSVNVGDATSTIALNPRGGYVGIGTTSPSNTLTVSGDADFTGNVGIGTSASIDLAVGDSDTGLDQKGDGELAIMTNNVERMRITSGGNVGIGTTTPGAKLDVNGNMFLSGGYRQFGLLGGNSNGYIYGNFPALGDGIHMGYNYYVNSNNEHVIINPGGGTSRITMQYGNLDFATAGAGAGNPSSKMFINSEGNVGIGTTAPQAELDVNGEFKLAGSKPIILQRYPNCGTGWTSHNTLRSVNDYVAAIAGFRTHNGDINEIGEQSSIITVQINDVGGQWHIVADFASHETDETWDVDVLFIDRRMADIIGY